MKTSHLTGRYLCQRGRCTLPAGEAEATFHDRRNGAGTGERDGGSPSTAAPGPAAEQRRRTGVEHRARVQQHPDHDHQLREAGDAEHRDRREAAGVRADRESRAAGRDHRGGHARVRPQEWNPPPEVRHRPAGRGSADPDREGPEQAPGSGRDAVAVAADRLGRAGSDRANPRESRHQRAAGDADRRAAQDRGPRERRGRTWWR